MYLVLNYIQRIAAYEAEVDGKEDATDDEIDDDENEVEKAPEQEVFFS